MLPQVMLFKIFYYVRSRLSQRRGSAAARLMGLWVAIPPGNGRLSLVSVVFCQVEVSVSVDHSSRGVLPIVVCLNVIVKPR